MLRYFIQRILLLIPVLIGISLLVFFIMSFTPGTPGDIMLGDLAPESAKRELNESLGYYDPFFIRYFNYVGGAIRGDFGLSYRSRLPVFDEIAGRFPTTFGLALTSMVIAMVIGIPLGIYSAVRQYSPMDNINTILAMVFVSIPSFWLGLLMILFFSLYLRWLPSFGADTFRHYIMPSLAVSGSTMATLLRMTRSTMLEVLRQDYIRTAYAKGANERRVILKHAIKNAMIPIITVIGVNFGAMLGGAVIIESVFGMPGIGNMMLLAIRTKDIPIVMGGVLVVAVLFGLINLMLDLTYTFIDPRIKAHYRK